jgi:hypothetical protein
MRTKLFVLIRALAALLLRGRGYKRERMRTKFFRAFFSCVAISLNAQQNELLVAAYLQPEIFITFHA